MSNSAPTVPAKTAAKPAAKPAPKPAPKQDAPTDAKVALVRDSYTMPEPEYAQLDALKRRALGLGHPVKKSELLRAGVAALVGLSDDTLLAALQAVPPLKTGRPKGSKGDAAEAQAKPVKADKTPKAEKVEKAEKAEKAPKAVKAAKPVKAEKPAKAEKPGKAVKAEKAEKAEKPVKAAPQAVVRTEKKAVPAKPAARRAVVRAKAV